MVNFKLGDKFDKDEVINLIGQLNGLALHESS